MGDYEIAGFFGEDVGLRGGFLTHHRSDVSSLGVESRFVQRLRE